MRVFLCVIATFAFFSGIMSCKVQSLGTLPTVGTISEQREAISIDVETTFLESDTDSGIKVVKASREKGNLKGRNVLFLSKCPYESGNNITPVSREKMFNALYDLTDMVAVDDWFADVQKEISSGEKNQVNFRLSSNGLKSYILAGVGFDVAIAVCIESKEKTVKKTKVLRKLKNDKPEELLKLVRTRLAGVEGQLEEQRSHLNSLTYQVNRAYGSLYNMSSRAGMNQQIKTQYTQVLELRNRINENTKQLEELQVYYREKMQKIESLVKPVEEEVETEILRISAKLIFMGIPYKLERMYQVSMTGTKEDEIEATIMEHILGILVKGY